MNKLITTIGSIGVALLVSACASTSGSNGVVLPLDHGPRAQTTPWENQQRLLRAEQKAKAESEKQSQDSIK
nr:hypothetical protein [uncultured Duganella sp.]